MILKIYRSFDVNNDSYTAFEEEIENTDIPLLSICHVEGMVHTFSRHYPGVNNPGGFEPPVRSK